MSLAADFKDFLEDFKSPKEIIKDVKERVRLYFINRKRKVANGMVRAHGVVTRMDNHWHKRLFSKDELVCYIEVKLNTIFATNAEFHDVSGDQVYVICNEAPWLGKVLKKGQLVPVTFRPSPYSGFEPAKIILEEMEFSASIKQPL